MPHITVTGTADARIPADLANLSASVSAQGQKRDEVLNASYQAHSALVTRAKELVEEGAASRYIAGGVSTYSNSWRDERGEQVIEHRAQATVRLFVTALDRVGEISAELTESGADTNVSWELLSETEQSLMSGLRAHAVENARAAAEDYARALGAANVAIVSIRDSAGGGRVAPLGEARFAMASAASPIPELTVGEITVTAQIEVVFEAE